jgi:glyoxylase-like metal-dependent hydrolase (beta-lactamase superfamily II)
VVIDPGASILEMRSIIANLKSSVKYALLTHGHYDHIISALVLGAPVYAHEAEKSMLEDPKINLSSHIRQNIILKNVNYFRGKTRKLDEFEIFHTPGHTAGSVIIKTGTNLFTGDTLFLDTVGRTDGPTGDAKQLKASLKIFDSFDKDLMCYPGHGEPFLLSEAYEANYFLKKDNKLAES